MKALPNNLRSALRRIMHQGVLILLLGPSDLCAQGYTDVAPAQGLDFLIPVQAMSFNSEVGSGVCFFDFDGDGWDDLTFANTDDSLLFYRNVQGTLERLPSVVPGLGQVKQVLWADIDNDGDPDLFVTTMYGPVRLFRNDGGWNFTDITQDSGLIPGDANHYGASFGDHDRDGFLDLYVCTYTYLPIPYAYSKLNHLYRNNGDGTFTDVTLQAGVGNGMRASFQSVWLDVDVDGWPDLYVINDFTSSNALYRNNGDGTFTNLADTLGLRLTGEHPMSISPGDIDNDGDLDLFMTNTGIFPSVNNARSMLMLNNGSGVFEESSEQFGLDVFEWGWGSLWVDHDNDGFLDLFIATHREFGPPVANQFHRNEQGMSFSAADDLFPGPQLTASHAVARGDLDRDGYADIIVQNQAPFPPVLWRNEGGEAHHVRITLEGSVSNRQAIGSWIRVYAGGTRYVHYTVCGENYLGQSSQHISFGLGDATLIDSIEVEYLSGHTDRYYDLAVDQAYRFVEGDNVVVDVVPSGVVPVCAPDTVVLDAGEHFGYLWNTGDTGRYLSVYTSGAYQVTVVAEFGITASSDTVFVVIDPSPAVIADKLDPRCHGDANGSIQLNNLTGVEALEVVWDNGSSGTGLEGLSAGGYTFVFTDLNGCVAEGQVELFDPEPLFVLVESVPVDQGGDGAFSWTIFGGSPPYTSMVDGVLVEGTSIEPLAEGMYALVVVDTLGCSFAVDVEVMGPVGLGTHGPFKFHAHPNPTRDLLYVTVPERPLEWRLLDMNGRVLDQGRSNAGSMALDLVEIASGTYMIQLFDGPNGIWYHRVMKN